MDFRKAVKASKGVFKPQHCEWAKWTVGTNGKKSGWLGTDWWTVRGRIVWGTWPLILYLCRYTDWGTRPS